MISDDGAFTAEFVQEPALSVPLGSSGSSVQARLNEDRSYSVMIGGEWVMVTADTQVTAANGNVYGVEFVDGIPRPVYNAHTQEVMLGALGGTVTLTRAEDMTWWLGEMAVTDGYMHVAANGNTYALMMDAEGMWSAMYQQVMVTVALGTQGSVELVRAEDMSWWLGSEAVTVGSDVTSDNGNMYTLWYTDGTWSARFEPMSMMIEGTGLVAMTREADDMYDVEGATLPSSGMGDIDTSMGTYRITMMDGMLSGVRLDNVSIDTDTDYATMGIRTGVPTISGDEDDTEAVNEAKTMLSVGGDSYSFGDLLGDGVAMGMGTNFVAKAKSELETIRGQIEAVLLAFDTDSQRDAQVDRLWGTAADDDVAAVIATTNVRRSIARVFGNAADVIASAPDDDNALGAIDDLIAALSSVDGLEAALADGGVFEDADANGKSAETIFDATSVESSVSYGVTGMTRYGALVKKERTIATAGAVYTWDTDLDDTGTDEDESTDDHVGQLGAFAFGVTAETARARYVQSSGNAYYEGATLAVSSDGTHYSGDIGLRVRFATEKVDGLITNLMSADGEPWVYFYGDADSIVLPTANMNANGQWTVTGNSSITFAQRPGSPGPQMATSMFAGRLLGTGDDAGYQAVGTWSVGENPASSTYIAGGFGAERTSDEPDVRPDPGDGIDATLMSTSDINGGLTSLSGGMLKITVQEFGYERNATELIASGSIYDWERLPADLNGDGDTDDTTLPEADVGDVNLDGITVGQTADEDNAATRTYEISLASLLAKEGAESNHNGGKYVDMAREMIQAERNRLAVLIDSDQLPESQATIWQNIQLILMRYVFNAEAARTPEQATAEDPAFAGRLPVSVSGDYDESTALDRVDRILDALSSASNLEAALDPDENAFFVDDDDNPFVNRAASDMFNEKDSQVKTWIGSTDYTRFGVWRVRRSRNALRSGGWQNAEMEAFAYSPLPAATVMTADAPNYPAGASATYSGKTVAFVGTAGYEGTIDLHVDWGVNVDGGALVSPNPGTDPVPVGGRFTTVISGLQNASGDILEHRSDGATVSFAVRDIVFSRLAFVTDDDGVLDFSSTTTTATVNFMDRNQTAASGLALPQFDGTFVGASADGPLGVMGVYEITFQTGTDGDGETNLATTINGAFGADLP